jgi:hypothetical protein
MGANWLASLMSSYKSALKIVHVPFHAIPILTIDHCVEMLTHAGSAPRAADGVAPAEGYVGKPRSLLPTALIRRFVARFTFQYDGQ